MSETVYQCCKRCNDVNGSPIPAHYADTETEAIEWLKRNGGGVYRNLLHQFQMEVA